MRFLTFYEERDCEGVQWDVPADKILAARWPAYGRENIGAVYFAPGFGATVGSTPEHVDPESAYEAVVQILVARGCSQNGERQ